MRNIWLLFMAEQAAKLHSMVDVDSSSEKYMHLRQRGICKNWRIIIDSGIPPIFRYTSLSQVYLFAGAVVSWSLHSVSLRFHHEML